MCLDKCVNHVTHLLNFSVNQQYVTFSSEKHFSNEFDQV